MRTHRLLGPIGLSGAAAAAAVLTGSACTGSLNTAVGPFGVDLPDLAAATATTRGDVPLLPSDAPWTPVPFDRTTWPTVVVSAPRGQVEVNPTPAFEIDPMPGREIPVGPRPSPEKAVSVETDGGRVTTAALLDPLRSAWSLIESPVGLVIRPPWQVRIEPIVPIEMLPPRGDRPIGIRRLDMPVGNGQGASPS
jgi:hypothetical protein